MAVDPDGVITAQLRLDTSNVSRDLREGLAKDQAKYEKDMRSIGKRIGNDISDEVRRHPALRTAVRDSLVAAEKLDRAGYRSIGRRISQLIANEFTSNQSPLLRAFKGFQQTFGSFFGSILNLGGGGKNPAIFAVMALFIGDIIALVLIAIHGVQALIAMLAVIPNLLFAIGLQAAALLFIFHGFSQVFSALAAAKSLGELNKALVGVNPALAAFIRTLYPLKELFSKISDAAKTQFFGALGNVFTLINKNIGTTLYDSIVKVSKAMGEALSLVLSFFATPLFKNFLAGVTPSVVAWLKDFGDAIAYLLKALTIFGKATQPFFEKFGEKFNDLIVKFADWLLMLANSPTFQQDLMDAMHTLHIIIQLLGTVWGWLKRIEESFKSAGADKWIDQLRHYWDLVNKVFDLIGPDAMKSLVPLLAAAVLITTELVVGITLLFYIITQIYKFIGFIVSSFVELYRWLVSLIHPSDALREGLDKAKTAIMALGPMIITFFTNLGQTVLNFLMSVGTQIWTFFSVTIPDRIKNAAKDFINTLYEAGRNLIMSLINGMISAIPGLRALINTIGGMFGFHTSVTGLGGKNPPGASTAPGVTTYTVYDSQGNIKSQNSTQEKSGSSTNSLTDFKNVPLTSSNNTSSAVFSNGAVQINVNSTNPPSNQQAQDIGTNVALGLQEQLVSRSVRTA